MEGRFVCVLKSCLKKVMSTSIFSFTFTKCIARFIKSDKQENKSNVLKTARIEFLISFLFL